jgi:hypothetical protein
MEDMRRSFFSRAYASNLRSNDSAVIPGSFKNKKASQKKSICELSSVLILQSMNPAGILNGGANH